MLLYEPGDRSDVDAGDGARVRCPKCGWEPRREDRWVCTCGHFWNTFETRGVCPGCGHAWQETQCQRCHQWSAHEDWYVADRGKAS